MKKLLLVILGLVLLLAVGLAGQLDHDEYIEVNSRPQIRVPY